MKRTGIIMHVMLFVQLSMGYGQTVLFSEDFESGEIPLTWKQEFTKGSISWRYEDGGYTLNPTIPNSRKPIAAHGGEFNALFQYQSSNSEATKLVTKRIDALEFAIKPELHFFNAQFDWKHGADYYHDYLRVYYKSSATSPWILLNSYTGATTDWVERIILLPEGDLSADYYLAFEGETKWGWGTCVDDIQIIETGILQKTLNEISVEQASDVSVSSGTINNPILKLKLKVMGNSGTCPLNSLVLNSLNTADNDIEPGGVKLFITQSAEFNADNQIGTGVGFSSGQAVFSSLNYDLPTGYSYLWITYDVKPSAGHRNTLDARFAANSISINGQNYFSEEKSPAGSRLILQTIQSDNFESGSDWSLSGEFEYGSPMGLGGSQGNPDPDNAFSGTKVIGSDLTGMGDYAGDYEKDLVKDADYAISDTFDFTYYNDLSIRYMRHLNIGVNDEASVDVSSDGGITWQEAWFNSSMILDDKWKLHEIDITEQAARKSKVLIRYSIGTTNDYWQLSGWNIDDFSVTGNYVSKDVGISRVISPIEGCGHTSNETVTVMVKNFGAFESYGVIPLQYSFDGNETIVYDTLYQAIPFGDSVQFTFKKKVDLSVPDIYGFTVKTGMNDDDDPSNDGIEKLFYAQPTIHGDFSENFESKGGLWIPHTVNPSSWEWGSPGFGIDPPSGTKLWMTRLIANYPENDSSFVESVCYQNNNSRKILQLKYWVKSESNKDGAAVQYSIDGGVTWQLLDTLISGWNWYTGDVQALNSKGWSGDSEGWITARQILPKSITAAPTMKFRLAFASDSENSDIGLAFDDFSITTAPNDIGVLQIDDFGDACQDVNPDRLTVTIKNFGINKLAQNDTVIVGFDLNQEQITIDTFKLSSDLLPGGIVKHTFATPVDAEAVGNYNLTAYTLIEDDPYFYQENNDTASVDFEVYPNPITSMIDTIQTYMPDTVVLRPYFHADYDYLWNDLSTGTTYDVENAGWYFVTVTATRGNGCVAHDSSYVELLFNDVGAEHLVYPVDDCGLTGQEFVTVRIKNYGTDSIASGQKIAIAYELDNGLPVTDTLKLTSKLYSGHSIDYTFTRGAVDLSGKGIYSFKLYTAYGSDTIAINDTIVRNVEILGRPAVDLGPDKTVQALSYTLNAGSGYNSYLWDNGISSQTREINETGTYWVQVFDENQCDNFDTAYIRLKIRDIRPDGLASPVSDCRFSPSETVSLRILNSGTDTVPSGTSIAVSYQLNEDIPVTGSVSLMADLLPGLFVTHSFPGTVNLNNPADYNFRATAVMTGDIRTSNDTADITLYRYAKPVVDFGLDEIEYIEDIEFQIDAGFSPYYTYQWQDGWDEHLYTATGNGRYSVKAIDNRTSCFDQDTVSIFLIYSDVGVTLTDMPLNGCTGEFGNVKVRIKNLGTTSIGKDAPIFVACDVNGTRVTLDTLIRSGNFGTNTELDLNLSGKVKINTGGISQVAFYTLYGNDMKPWNDTLVVEFDALPGPVIDFGDVNGILNTELPHVLDAGAGHKSYLWQDASSMQTFTVTQAGIYSVTVTGQNDCQSSKTVRINLPSSIGDIQDTPGQIIIYPNPNNGLFRIASDASYQENILIRIINNQGQLVYNREVLPMEIDNESIDVQHLPRGVYHVVIYSAGKPYQGKMIIE